MSSNNTSKYALAGITIAASLLLALSVTVSFNWYYTNYFLEQKITNIFNNLIQNLPPIKVDVNVTQPTNQTGNVTQVAPTVQITSPITCAIGTDCVMTAKVDDPDGTVSQVIWNQESEQQAVTLTKIVDHTTTPDTYIASFKPTTGGKYVFSVEAQDNDGKATLKSVTVNIPTPTPTPTPQPTCKSDEVYNATLDECVAKPKPTPQPQPTPSPTPVPDARPITFTVTGDIEDSSAGKAVFEQVKKQNATFDFVLGDLGYASDISWFKSSYGSLGDKMYCVVGNHESANEDGSSSLEKATKEFCGDSYWFKSGVNLFLFFNTNGDLSTQSAKAVELLHNTTVTNGAKNLFIFSHKPCVSPPNSHHPAPESSAIKSLCDKIQGNLPAGIKVFYNQAHNHVMSSSADGTYKQSGAGGRSHYTCPSTTTTGWFCDNSHYGFLKYYIKADGTTAAQFIDYNGKVLYTK